MASEIDSEQIGLTEAQRRESYFLALRNTPGEERISDLVEWQRGPEYNDPTRAQHALPPVEEALNALFPPEEVERYTQGATFAELWPALDAMQQPTQDQQTVAGASRIDGFAAAVESGAEMVAEAVADYVGGAIDFLSESLTGFLGGGSASRQQQAEPRPMTAQESRRAAREAAEAEARADRDRRAAEQQSAQQAGQEESRGRDGGMSI